MLEGKTQIANPSVSTQSEQEVQEPVPKRCRLLHLQSDTLDGVTTGKLQQQSSRANHSSLAAECNNTSTQSSRNSNSHHYVSYHARNYLLAVRSGLRVNNNTQRSTPPVATFSLRKAKLKHNLKQSSRSRGQTRGLTNKIVQTPSGFNCPPQGRSGPFSTLEPQHRPGPLPWR